VPVFINGVEAHTVVRPYLYPYPYPYPYPYRYRYPYPYRNPEHTLVPTAPARPPHASPPRSRLDLASISPRSRRHLAQVRDAFLSRAKPRALGDASPLGCARVDAVVNTIGFPLVG
jgi:hypothetical protein